MADFMTKSQSVADAVSMEDISKALEASTRMAMDPRLSAALPKEVASEIHNIHRCLEEFIALRLLLVKLQQAGKWVG